MYTFGADPELFVFDTRKNKFISAHGLIPGTKSTPYPVEHGAVQLDGVAAEFNIDPVTNFKDFKRNIDAVRRQLTEMVQAHSKDYVLVAKPTAKFDQGYFDDVIPADCKILGCDPDYSADTGMANPRPDPGNRPFRTGGGHVHIGWTNGVEPLDPAHFKDCRIVAYNLFHSGMCKDYLWDSDNERRQLYGSRYSFRPKPFGMEYRYLSNAWVDNPEAMEFVFNVAAQVVESLDAEYNKKVRTAKRHRSIEVPANALAEYQRVNRDAVYEGRAVSIYTMNSF